MYFTSSNSIKSIISYKNQNINASASSLNIAYGADQSFLLGCVVSITSILTHNADLDFSFHIFTDNLNSDYKNKLELLSKEFQTTITIYIVKTNILSSLLTTKNWSHAMYYRFIAADILSITTDRLLYLDSDIICKKRIQEIRTIQLNNYIVAAVKDGDISFWNERAKTLDKFAISNGYFNSGVLLINLSKWNDEKISEQAITLLSNNDIKKVLKFPDQDVLNLLLCESTLYLPHFFNMQTSINFELQCHKGEYYKHPIADDTIFIHYIGPTKPWHRWAKYPICYFFNDAKMLSPWRDDKYLSPKSPTLIRYKAKHELHQGKIFKGYITYLTYFYSKLTKVFSV